MATAYTVPAILRVTRSTQSGLFTMTAAWQVVYTNSAPYAWLFVSADINLTPMIAGDTIDIRVRKINVSGGAEVVHSLMTYSDVQPVNHPAVRIGPLMDVYGVEVAMRQTAGVLADIQCEFFDAFR
ncbi:hypothetical protein LCGC14_0607440 [marine sediment metagenome]|uniref:Uncharacterized protein n=1 Tax=marine sediment metagenome TaxID=412755 RepID=A0A0F9UH74_9ZZZZ